MSKLNDNDITDVENISIRDTDSMTIWQEEEFDAIQLPEDAPLSLVIKLLNDMQFIFTDDKRVKTWKTYVKTIKLKDDKK